jgi:hypothetical protein
VIKLNECELDYPTMTRFKVWVGKKEKHKPSVRADKACTLVRADGINEWVYMGEYGKGEIVREFGERWLDRGRENGVRWVEIYLI